jgi:hypothetical protein
MRSAGAFGSGRGLLAARVVVLLAVATAALGATADGGTASRVPQPTIAVAAPGKCVEDTPFMRRNHMELLKHHRDLTVHEGIRTTQHSLANCVTCHASKETGRVTGSKDAFCQGCHSYAAVKLDCFECHTDRAATGVAAAGAAMPPGAPR